jgi:glycosyltransferase involved in cell wall biosynthesis
MHAAIARWLSDNGIAAHQTLNLGATAQRLMPEVFREVDLAVFPNRCEGGTNLVAMEAMASGLPCVLSANTGHLDLIQEDACIALRQQSAVTQPNTQGWGESDVDELLEAMESVYQGRTRITPNAARQAVAHFSWKNSIDNLLALF